MLLAAGKGITQAFRPYDASVAYRHGPARLLRADAYDADRKEQLGIFATAGTLEHPEVIPS